LIKKVTAILFFDPKDTSSLDAISKALDKASGSALKVSAELVSTYTIEDCKHDENPPGKCAAITAWTKA